MSDKNNFSFDIAIYSPSDSTVSDMQNVNRKLYSTNKPFLHISFNGSNLTVGPLVVPRKTACLECGLGVVLKKINTKMGGSQKVKVNDIKNLKLSWCDSDNYDKATLEYVSTRVVADVSEFFNGLPSIFLDTLYTLGSGFVEYKSEESLPTTNCNFCSGMNQKYIRVKTDAISKAKEILTMSSNEKSTLNEYGIE